MSLRRRLVLGFLVVAVALVAGGVFLAITMRHALVDRVDQQLAAVRPDRFGGFNQLETQGRLSEYYFATLDAERKVVRSSRSSLGTADEPPPAPAALTALAAKADPGAPALGTVPREGGNGSSYRVRIVKMQVPELTNVYFVVGQSLRDVDHTFRRIVIAEAITALAVLATLAVVAEWVLRQGVRPLDAIAEAADGIAGGDLSRRVTTTSPSTEAGRVGIAFNRMLGQIEDDIRHRDESEQRLKRFVADASHELRTPLTSIRGYADLWRQGGFPDDVSRDDAMRRVEHESARMGRLVDDLLLLARLDEGIPLASGLVDLSTLASECVTDARVVDPERQITLAAAAPVVVVGDEDRLRQVISNLLANARTHTPPLTPVHVRVSRVGAQAIIEVRDEGSGMDAAIASRVFDRFYRADPARSRAQGGSGLGLAIVAATVSLHRGTVAVDTAPGQGARFVVTLPLAPSATTIS
jgi:two-component system OmpR family sensor kinase